MKKVFRPPQLLDHVFSETPNAGIFLPGDTGIRDRSYGLGGLTNAFNPTHPFCGVTGPHKRTARNPFIRKLELVNLLGLS